MKHNVGPPCCLVPNGDLNTYCFQMVQRILIIVILYHKQQKQKKLNKEKKKTTDQKISLQHMQYWLFMKVSHIKTLKSFLLVNFKQTGSVQLYHFSAQSPLFQGMSSTLQ
jgi:hypothetical protein